MSKQTISQRDEQYLKEQERLRLLGKSREILKVLEEETIQNSLNVFNYLINKIQGKVKLEIEKKLIKDVCPEELPK